jgi:hypothetical protein
MPAQAGVMERMIALWHQSLKGSATGPPPNIIIDQEDGANAKLGRGTNSPLWHKLVPGLMPITLLWQ